MSGVVPLRQRAYALTIALYKCVWYMAAGVGGNTVVDRLGVAVEMMRCSQGSGVGALFDVDENVRFRRRIESRCVWYWLYAWITLLLV